MILNVFCSLFICRNCGASRKMGKKTYKTTEKMVAFILFVFCFSSVFCVFFDYVKWRLLWWRRRRTTERHTHKLQNATTKRHLVFFFSHTTIEVNIVVDAITVGMDDEQRTNHKTRRSSDGLCLSSQAFRCRCTWPNDWIRIKGKPRTNKQHKNHRKQQQQPAAAEVS